MGFIYYDCPKCKNKIHLNVFIKEMNYCPKCGTFVKELKPIHKKKRRFYFGILLTVWIGGLFILIMLQGGKK